MSPSGCGDSIEVDFEGRRFFSPRESEFLLYQMYGDYMKFTPEDERGGWHSVDDFHI